MAAIEMVGNPTDGAGPSGQFHAAELDNIYRALNGHGVIGHTLSMTVTGGDMIVTIPAFAGWVPDSSGGSVYVSYAGGNETISAAHATLPRVDIIELRSGGTVEVVTGTPTAETGNVLEAPMPALSANAIMLAKVKVGANVTVIATDKVYGRAIDVSEQYAMRAPKGSDIASAATITLPDSSAAVFDITGTTTITAISSKPAGAIVIFQFDGALTLTHNATSLVLEGGGNHLTTAGDIVAFVSEGSGNWRELFRKLANGQAWEHIDTQVLSGAAASVSFASLPTPFRLFKLTAFMDVTAALSTLLRLNNDSAGNYEFQALWGTGATPTSARSVAQTSININGGAGAGDALEALMEILIGKQAAGQHAVVSWQLSYRSAANTPLTVVGSGAWLNTADLISRIDLVASASTYAADSRVVLEGCRTP